MSARVEVQRVDLTAMVWFAAAVVALAVVMASLIVSGWRPSELPPGARLLWWLGLAATGLGVSFIGYAGCPVYWGTVAVAHVQKSIAIRAGLALFLGGSAAAAIAILLR